jgi:uncharacterized protein YndB with AHSA1/START domain
VETMHIRQQVLIRAQPERVFESLLDVSGWFARHVSSEPAALVLEPHVGGRFREEFNDQGDGALFAHVTLLQRNRRLRLYGPLGMDAPVVGVIDFTLEESVDGTVLHLTHRAVGELDEERMASYDAGWRELLHERLKPLVEDGKRYLTRTD